MATFKAYTISLVLCLGGLFQLFKEAVLVYYFIQAVNIVFKNSVKVQISLNKAVYNTQGGSIAILYNCSKVFTNCILLLGVINSVLLSKYIYLYFREAYLKTAVKFYKKEVKVVLSFYFIK